MQIYILKRQNIKVETFVLSENFVRKLVPNKST